MLERFRRWREPDDTTLDRLLVSLTAAPGLALPVLALAPHLERPVRRSRALELAAVAGLDPAAAALHGGRPARARVALDGASVEARFVRAVAALAAAGRAAGAEPRLWPAAARRRLFDPETLVLPCAHDRLLARLAEAVWSRAAARMRLLGDEPAWRALESWGFCRPEATNCGSPLPFTSGRPCV